MTAHRYNVAYGIVENPARVLSALPAPTSSSDVILSPSAASLTSKSPALRINSAGWMRLPAEAMARLHTQATLKDYCRRRIEKKASVFDRPLADFLAGYLDIVEAEVGSHAASLAGGASWDAALFSTADWFFSAFLPLPNAHLELAAEERRATGAAEFLRFDALFWTGSSLFAVTLERLSTPTARLRDQHARFAAMRPDITFVTIPAGNSRAAIESKLGALCHKFWEGLRYPLGPYRPEAFGWRPAP